jgi:hypothetical protein
MSKWTEVQVKAAQAVRPELSEEQVIAALDKGVKLTQATEAQVATFKAMKVDLSAFPQQDYAAAKDIDRIYLASKGPKAADPQVRALVLTLKREHGMNANQVAALIGVPPRFINGMYSAAVKAEAAAKVEAAKVA